MTRWLLATVVVLLLCVAFVPLDAATLRRGIGAASMGGLVSAVALYGVIQPLAAMQWRCLLAPAPVSWRRLLRLFSYTSLANNSVNSLAGHAAGVAMLAAEPGIGTDAAFSLLVLDQLCVGIAKLAVLSAAVGLLPVGTWIHRGITTVVLAVTLLVLTIVVARVRPRWPVFRAMVVLPPHQLLAGMACALGVKLLEGAAIAAVQFAFGVPVSVSSVLLVLAAVSVATLVPVVPANLGTYEAAVFIALQQVGVTRDLAMVMAVVQHACQLLAALAPGALLMWRPWAPAVQRP
jgi:uncharacterized membrane protein YbhN (UPF0104 family)